MKYGLIGEKLGHSFSAEIHAGLGLEGYQLTELAPSELESFMREKAFEGINVTIPYKQAVIPYLDELSEEASGIGAVNTIVNRSGHLTGYNTDFTGMKQLIERAGICAEGKKVLIAGSGGTSLTAAKASRSLGAAEVIRLSRSGINGAMTYEEGLARHADAQILINTTPSGMYPDTESEPVDIDSLKQLEGVIDVVYNPLTTKLVRKARARGIPAENGLYMLVAKAAAAEELFTGTQITSETVDRVFREILLKKSNIVLTGMPGSGKSTVAKLLSERLSRDIRCVDEMIAEREGRSIPEIFRTCGEQGFRDAETAVIREVSQTGGQIIDTGGGAVLRAENVDTLRMNGIIIFLDRQPEDIRPTDDRPLADSMDKIRKLYEVRYPVYKAAADVVVASEATADETASAVWRALQWT